MLGTHWIGGCVLLVKNCVKITCGDGATFDLYPAMNVW